MTTGPLNNSLADDVGDSAAPSAERFAALYGQIRRIAQRHMRGEAPGHTLSATGLANEVWLRMRAQGGPRAEEEVPDQSHDQGQGQGQGRDQDQGQGRDQGQAGRQALGRPQGSSPWDAAGSALAAPAHDAFDLAGAADIRQDQLLALCSTFMRRILVDHARGKLADKRGALLAQDLTQSVLEAIAAPTDRDTVAVHDTLLAFEAIDPRAAKVVEMRFFGGLSLDEIASATGRSTTSVKRDWTFARAWLHNQLGAQEP